MQPEYCAFCRGMVTDDNQTRHYGGEDEPEFMPGATPRARKVGRETSLPDAETLIETSDEFLAETDLDEFEKPQIVRMEARDKKEIEMKKENDGEKKCRVQGCTRKVIAKGFCLNDYDKWRRGKLPGDFPPYQTVRQAKKKTAEPPEKEKLPTPEFGAIHKAPPGGVLLLNLREYPEIFEALRQAARKHIRSIEHQAISCVRQYLVQENYITEERE